MRKLKLMIASILYVSCINFALAENQCEYYKFSVHNKNANKMIFVKAVATKKQVGVKPGATEFVGIFGVGETKVEVFDNKKHILFKGKVTKDRSAYAGETLVNRFGSRQIFIAGPIDLFPIVGSVGIDSSHYGDCTYNKMGEYTIAV